MKRSALTRLQNSDVFYAPKSLGLQALRQNSIMCEDMELNGLHPQSCLYAQSIIGETLAFTDWVSKVLKKKWGISCEELLERVDQRLGKENK